MINFEEISVGSDRFLRIKEDTSSDISEIPIHDPLVKGIAKPWPNLTIIPIQDWTEVKNFGYGTVHTRHILHSRHHSKSAPGIPFETLGNRIASKETYWGDSLKISGEFEYTEGYWEWVEDILSRSGAVLEQARIYDAVYASLYTYDSIPDMTRAFCESWSPSTNTLVTAAGELSISLWDLHQFGGLPILGELFDEVVPSPCELTGYTKEMERHLPASCGHLLHAYHLICHKKTDDKILISDWINFWCNIPVRYFAIPERRERKTRRLSSTHNPSGVLPRASIWGRKDRMTFSILGIPDDLKEETYLAAFISCWLCLFVLPSKSVGQIRPGVFKMACLMAKGDQVGLAIPVLSCIYRGLNAIADSGILC